MFRDSFYDPTFAGGLSTGPSFFNKEEEPRLKRQVPEKPRCPRCEYVEGLPNAKEVRTHCEVRNGEVVRDREGGGVICKVSLQYVGATWNSPSSPSGESSISQTGRVRRHSL